MFISVDDDLTGVFHITFVGAHKLDNVVIDHPILAANGQPLYLVGPNKEFYPWSTIIRMVKKSDGRTDGA